MSGSKSVKLGDLAEDLVTAWATRAGITVNDARRDRRGWDLFFEFPRRTNGDEDGWLDARPPELVCQVQVKGTRAAKRISVKLTNWERHVKSPLPVVFVVVRFDADLAPTEVYVSPVDQERIEDALRRLRRLAAAPPPKSGRPGTLDLRWRPDEKLPEIDGPSLRDAIRAHVGEVATYPMRKARRIASAGVKDPRGPYKMTITTGPGFVDADFEAFSELAVGLRESIPISRVLIHEERFDIGRIVHDTQAPASFSVGEVPPFDTVRLGVRRGEREAGFHAEAYLSPYVFPFLPVKFWKLRCVTPAGQVIVRPREVGSMFFFETNDLSERTPLRSLRDFTRVAALVADEGEDDVEISVRTSAGVEVRNAGTIGLPEIGADLVRLGDVVEQAAVVARSADLVDADVVPLELLDLKPRLDLMCAAYRVPTPVLRLGGFLDECPPDLSNGAMAVRAAVPLGASIVFQLVAVAGEAEWRSEDDGGGWVVVRGIPQLLVQEVIKRSDWAEWLPGAGFALVESALAVLEGQGIRHVWR